LSNQKNVVTLNLPEYAEFRLGVTIHAMEYYLWSALNLLFFPSILHVQNLPCLFLGKKTL